MKRLYLILAAALILSSAALWACSSDDDSDDSSSTPTESSSSTPGGTEESSDTPSSSEGESTFQELVDKAKLKEAKVAYDFTAAGSSGSFTLYSKPPASYRFDYNIDGSTGTMLSSGDNLYFCDEASAVCYASPVGSAIPIPFINYFQDPSQLGNFVGDTAGDLNHETKTIAGQDADCYTGSAEGSSGEVCFSNDGILLSMHGDDGQGTSVSLEATTVEGTVADADLTPPYPIQSLGQ